ncbi:MAG: hypothetical protein WCF28_12230, partial [Methanobacterium sp.]|uniref:hypothetical protein n=1 Tax=Methanobacterium sp. TaxID=2164 RepID=UPI003C77A299
CSFYSFSYHSLQLMVSSEPIIKLDGNLNWFLLLLIKILLFIFSKASWCMFAGAEHLAELARLN